MASGIRIRAISSTPQSLFECNRVLQELSKAGRIDDAQKLFDEFPHRDEYTWNTMIAAYSSSGRLADASNLFASVPTKSSVTWSSLISGYCQHQHASEAFRLFWKMRLEGDKPSQFTLGSILSMCSSMGKLRSGRKIHGYTVKTHFDCNDYVIAGLVDMYAKNNCIIDAERLFQAVPEKDRKNHVLWTALITGYSQSGDGFKAMEYFRDMRFHEVEANQFTFPSVLKACSLVYADEFGSQMHGLIEKSGFGLNLFVHSALIDMYAKCGRLDNAKRVLETGCVDDVVCWNSLIVGFVRQGFAEQARSLFRKMRAKDIRVDEFTIPSLLNSLATLDVSRDAESVHGLIFKTGFECYKLVRNALIDLYAKQGKMNLAFDVFKIMENKDVVSWTSLVSGYAQNGFYEDAIRVYGDMRFTGVCLDEIIISCVISACAELTVLELGQQVHGDFVKSGIGPSLSVDNSIMSMYAKCGSIEDATMIFNSMEHRNLISWTAIIDGYARNGKGKESLELYDLMIHNGLKPDFVTFIGVLFTCSHSGEVEKGRNFFTAMKNVYGISPGPQHYACMIDLLVRSGNFAEVEEMLNRMEAESVEIDSAVWKAILASCRSHKNLELGERAANNLFLLEPRNAVPYVLLSNLYFAVGRAEDAANLRRLMKLRGIHKEPGISWLEINSKIHTFTSEDRGHPRIKEIYGKIDEVMCLIKRSGYVPDTSFALHDLDEKGKEQSLAYHSEKLAVALGLLVLPPGSPIRIFKNLRVCGDCHSAMKFISRVYSRHVILRDSNCFHHFRGGICSCEDYW